MPAAADNFIIKVVPIFSAPLPKVPKTPRGLSHHSSTLLSGGTLDYVTSTRDQSSLRGRSQQTLSINGSPLDLCWTDWDRWEDQDGQVVMLIEAQLQTFLQAYGQNVSRYSGLSLVLAMQIWCLLLPFLLVICSPCSLFLQP